MRRINYRHNLAIILLKNEFEATFNDQKSNRSCTTIRSINKEFNKNFSERNIKKRIKLKTFCKTFSRLMVILFSLAGFIYQGGRVTMDYLKFGTIVKINYETQNVSILPAITVCYPMFTIWPELNKFDSRLDHYADKLIKMYEDMKFFYTDQELYRLWGENDSFVNIDGKPISPFKLFDYFQRKAFNQKSVVYMFNISVPNYINIYNTINETISGRVSGSDSQGLAGDYYSNNTDISIMVDDNNIVRKCFTLFKTVDLFEKMMQIQQIMVNVNFLKEWYKKEFLKEPFYLFSIHEPNFIPPSFGNNYLKLRLDKRYIILFSRIRKHFLESPYKTNCLHYSHEIRNQLHCIEACMSISATEICGKCIRPMSLHPFSYIDPSLKLCNFTDQDCSHPGWFKNKRYSCESSCQVNCDSESYDFFVTSETDNLEFNTPNSPFETTTIRIIHKPISDIDIEHFPEFSLHFYVATMGGLAGMWLGFSVIAFYDYLIKTISLFIKRN